TAALQLRETVFRRRMPARPWRARATPARTAAGGPRAPAATGHAAATRTTLEPGRAKENGLARASARRSAQAGRTFLANRAPRRGEPGQRPSARRDMRGEPAERGWPPSWARRP